MWTVLDIHILHVTCLAIDTPFKQEGNELLHSCKESRTSEKERETRPTIWETVHLDEHSGRNDREEMVVEIEPQIDFCDAVYANFEL